MPRKKDPNKPKRDPWSGDNRPYGTYTGEAGHPRQWKKAYEERMSAKESADVLFGAKKSAHSILGLTDDVTDFAEIRRAFRKMVFQTHPDHGGTAEAFTEVRAAYSSLTDLYGKGD